MRSRRQARSASLSGARHGLAPKRNGQLGQSRASAHFVARIAAAIETVRPDSRRRSDRCMPERAQLIGSHLPRVASDRSSVWSRLGAEHDASIIDGASDRALRRPSLKDT
jgi:hypothetical protein